MKNFFKGSFILLLLVLTSFRVVVAAGVVESLRVSPSRVTLGGLSYGSKKSKILEREVVLTFKGLNEPLKITKVDVSQAPGIRLKGQRELSDQRVLIFEIDTGLLTKGQPFGKFIKVPIRLETNLAKFPQVVVVVLAWLSVNETARDFNDFQFKGSRRWEGSWGTPNMAGAVVVPFILLILGGLGWSWGVLQEAEGKRPTRMRRILRVITVLGLVLLVALVSWLLFLLGQTYSRGSWVALAVGLAVLMLRQGALRWLSLAAAGLFISMLVTMPAGVDRVRSYAQVEQDKSITNRLRLWTGALQAMGEHSLRGIGAGRFETVFKRDYKVLEHKADNSTPVSDWMTFGSERGVLFLGLGLGLLLFLLFEAVRSREVIFLSLGGMLASILTASTFSTLWFVRQYQVLFFLSVGGLLLVLGWRLRCSKDRKDFFIASLKTAFVFVVMSIVGVSTLAWIALRGLPTESGLFPEQGEVGSEAWVVEPRSLLMKGTVIYMGDAKDDLPFLAQTTLRPLAALGWRVVWPGLVENEEQMNGWLGKVKKAYPDQTIYIAGHGLGGKLAWSQASLAGGDRIRGAGYGFLTEDLGEGGENKVPQRKFLIYQSLYDDQVSANTAIRAERGQILKQVPMKIVLVTKNVNRFSKEWLEWVQAMNEHFAEER